MNRTYPMIVASAVCCLLAACGNESSTDRVGSSVANSSPTWMLTSEPGAALSIVDAKASAKEGDHIVVRGRIGGRKDPMSSASPVLTIMDVGIPHCAENPDDTCATPWDYCCVPKDQITAHSATVQIVGAEGGATTVDPRAAGLRELDEVVIDGVVGPRPSDSVLTIRAAGIYRVP